MQAQRGQGQRGFARPGLPDHPQGLAGGNLETGAMECHKLALAKPAAHPGNRQRIRHPQIPGLQDGGSSRIGPALHHVACRPAVYQFAGVGMLRLVEHLRHRPGLHNASVLHHGNAVGKAPHQVQVMGDQEHRHAVALLQPGQQVQDLRAQRDVQRRRGFVGQQQFGLAGQRHGNHGALALAPRQLVRVGAGTPGGLGDAGIR